MYLRLAPYFTFWRPLVREPIFAEAQDHNQSFLEIYFSYEFRFKILEIIWSNSGTIIVCLKSNYEMSNKS